jgi:hypothetical protein
MQRFDEKLPGENVVLAFNFTLFLATLPLGTVLAGAPVVTITDIYGGDTNPQAVLNGTPAIDTVGNSLYGPNVTVLVPVTGGLDMNDYVVTAECPTNNQYWTPALPAILPVRALPSKFGGP